jgi:hypothetical protein
MLEVAPGIREVAVFEEICRWHPELAPGVRRTLERRVGRWRAFNGPNRDMMLRQEHPPGRMSAPAFLPDRPIGRVRELLPWQWCGSRRQAA